MNLKNYFSVRANPTSADISLLLLRFVAGLAFMFHGWGKIQDPFGCVSGGAEVWRKVKSERDSNKEQENKNR